MKRARAGAAGPAVFHAWTDLLPEMQGEVRDRLEESARFSLALASKAEWKAFTGRRTRPFIVGSHVFNVSDYDVTMYKLTLTLHAQDSRLASGPGYGWWKHLYLTLSDGHADAADRLVVESRMDLAVIDDGVQDLEVLACVHGAEGLLRGLWAACMSPRQHLLYNQKTVECFRTLLELGRYELLPHLIARYNHLIDRRILYWAQQKLTHLAVEHQLLDAVHWLGEHGYLYPYCDDSYGTCDARDCAETSTEFECRNCGTSFCPAHQVERLGKLRAYLYACRECYSAT
jgi:hypothetical protein